LAELNQQMTEVSSSQAPSAALQHTLQRHHDILHDYTTEFQKTKSHLQSKKEREDLLGSVRRDIEYIRNHILMLYYQSNYLIEKTYAVPTKMTMGETESKSFI